MHFYYRCHEDNDNLIRLRGYELTTEYLEEHGFNVPIIVERPAGLDLVVPPPSFSIQDVENHVGKRETYTCRIDEPLEKLKIS